MPNKLLSAVILAGGLATRLRPLTSTIPKSLILIDQQPFIYHQLRLLAAKGIKKVIICAGFLGEMIQEHVLDGRQFGIEVGYSFDGQPLLGTGGAIKKALPQLGEAFFVFYGDSYLNCDYAAIQHTFEKQNKLGLMTVFRNNGQWDTSNVEFSDEKIIAYDKKYLTKRMLHIDYGLGIFSRLAFDQVPENEPYDLATLYQTLLTNQQLAGYEVNNRFYEIGSIAGIRELEYYLSQSEAIKEL